MDTNDIMKIQNGTRVFCFDGPGAIKHGGKVYGRVKSKWGDDLRIKMDDFTFEYLHSFTTRGIGWYLDAPRKDGTR